MSRFDRYVFWMIIKYLIIVEVIVTLIALMAAGVSDFRRFADINASFTDIVILQLIALPNKINSTLIISIVTASIIVVMLLMRSKEMLAYVSIGGRIGRMLYPFIFVTLCLAFVSITFEHKIYPHLKTARSRYVDETMKNEVYYSPASNLVDMWMIDRGERLIHAEVIDPVNKTVTDIIEYYITKDFQVESVRMIGSAVHNGSQWVLKDIHDADLLAIPPKTVTTDEIIADSPLLDDLTSLSGQRRKELEPAQLISMIKVLKGHGLSAVAYEMFLYSIYATALSGIVLIILVVPMGIDFSRRYSPLKSSVASFALALAFWGTLSASESFGYSGILPPLVASFLPHLLFLGIGAVLLLVKEKAR